jgi:hypothetical protein
MWLEFFLIDFRKIFKYQLSCKSVRWEPSCSMLMGGQTDRYDEANSSLVEILRTHLKALSSQNARL